ncbi:hypothetical protein, conserved in Apicomplexan species [Plasmodium knowlesi strain H]|uniref:Uncharacterized protein n=3 Tax=Plasmodium knowlesi TaxID=5850 RepID=A0A5K1UEE4_PLAKH|nr:uncharacterized protein PKNH_1315600 [Plasmodium knowlesi strain H]OTN68124.1 Uncharacterized protein PKNOH_S04349300 [Plasmodium knowlesi]CAA9990194.1 polyribonucleotide 5'-hydroxyl-kinase Clp1, putative [Plasmodium knowlesi strain H]SBO27477.1 hypothetical protein, conserved in Apicomplexan species [Plasmodium knowlesi strain H]SBO28482.1 hypothetical protein, conserved in Apicomplexan species [Plasmodium knowlesi strain H]VVS79668.1 polyribonucleotide 5'-hydroxyl-kinase Clp1, putative [P|eukprot:XP_002258107.1 [Plasmodium knowlesi strain H]
MANSGNTRIYHLKAFRELRIVTLEKYAKFEEENEEECVKVRLLPSGSGVGHKNDHNSSGNFPSTAEIFGRELIIDKEYKFGCNQKFAIYTFTGCTIQIKGRTLQEYESGNSTMKEYLSLSYTLDAYRKLAKKKKKIGPRVLITGNNNSGKSSVSLILLNYALKSGFKPIFIEADTKCTCDKVELNRGPGIMSAFVYDPMNRMKCALDYYFGYLDLNEDINLYYHLNECISSCVHLMLLNNLNSVSSSVKTDGQQEGIYAAGFILNVPSEADHHVINNLIEIYGINIVIVIDNAFLHYSLKDQYGDEASRRVADRGRSFAREGGSDYGRDYEGDYHHDSRHDNRHDTRHDNRHDTLAEGNRKLNSLPAADEERKDNKDMDDPVRKVEIVGMPKYEGVIPSDNNRIRYCKNMWYYQYFTKDIIVTKNLYRRSHIISFKYSLTNFIKLDTNLAVPLSALPADARDIQRENVTVSLYNGNITNLTNCILGVSYSQNLNYVHLMNIAAFVHVQSVRLVELEVGEDREKSEKGADETQGNADAQGSADTHKDYLIEILCPLCVTTKNLPPYFVVPGNAKQMKF